VASANDLYLLGIGYRHVEGGEDDFAGAGAKIKASGKEAAEGVGALDKSLDSVKDTIHDAIGEVAALAAAYLSVHAAIDSVMEGVKLFAEFDKGMAQLSGLANLTAGQFDLLSASAREIGASTIFGATDAAAGMSVLVKAQESVNQVIANQPAIERLAIIGHENLAAAADDVALSLHRFNLPAEQAGHIVDVLASMTQHSRASVGDLVDIMKQAGPAVGAAGGKFEDLAAVLGVMAQQGGNARQSGSAIVNMLGVLANPTQKLINDLKSLHLTLDDVNPRLRSIPDIIAAFARVSLDAGSASALFGHQAGTAILQLTQNLPALQAMQKQLSDVDGASEHLAHTMEDNLGTSGEKLAKVWESVKRSIGAGFAPALAQVSAGLQNTLRDWQSGAEALGHALGTGLTAVVDVFVVLVNHGRELGAVLVGLAVYLVALKFAPLAIAAWEFVAAIVGMTASGVGASLVLAVLQARLEAMWAAMLANPTTIVLVALAALAAIIFEVVSANRAAAAAQAEYNAELASGKPQIEGVTYAHDELIKKLQQEIDLRDKLSGKVIDNQNRLADLLEIEGRLSAAAGAGDTSAYEKAAADAQKLGVSINGINGSALEAVKEEVHALQLESSATADRITANNDRIATNQQQLRDKVVQAINDEVHARLEQVARITELEAQAARAKQKLDALNGIAFDDSIRLMAEQAGKALNDLADKAEEARKGLAAIDSAMANLRNNAVLKASDLFKAGDLAGAADLLRKIGTSEADIQTAVASQKKYNEQVAETAARLTAEKKAHDDALAAMREHARLIQGEVTAYEAMKRSLDVAIAGHEAVAAAYKISQSAGDAVKAGLDEQAKAADKASKFLDPGMRAAVNALALEELVWARNAAVASAAASMQAEINQKLAEGAAKVEDAVNGNALASRDAATATELENFAKKNLLGTSLQMEERLKTANALGLDAVVKVFAQATAEQKLIDQLKIKLALRDKELTTDALKAQKAADDLVFKEAELTATAALNDAINQSQIASQNLVDQLEIEHRVKAAGAKDDADRIAAITKEVHERHDSLNVLADQAVQVKALQDSYKVLDAAQAAFDDSQQLRSSTQAWGASISAILQKYGLLSSATKELALQEQARAIFNTKENVRADGSAIRTLAQITAELEARRKVSEEEVRGFANIEIAQLKSDQLYANLAESFNQISAAAGGTSTQIGRLAADLSGLVTALQKVNDAGKAFSVNWNNAMAAAVASVSALLKELNVGASNKTGGAQALGGRLDSNYAGIGTVVGTIIGGIIAAVLTEGSGTSGGAALGAAIGGVIGSMISKAGDSASATLRAGGNIQVNESSNQLNGAVKDALTNIFKGLQSAMAGLGLLLQGIPFIDIKVRDNIVRVIVGSVVRTFSSMQDAISFGIAEALKQTAGGAGGHLPEEVLQALQHTTATDLQALQSDIAFAQSIANYGVPQVVQAINKSISDFYVAMQRAVSLGIDTTKVVAQFVADIAAQKDSILQINRAKSPADQMKADAAAFNARMLLLKAQEEADIADLNFKKADLAGKVAIIQEQMRLEHTLDSAQLADLQIMQAALGQIDTAIASAQGVLAGIVLISDQELQDALARLAAGSAGSGKGGGGSTGTSLADQVAQAARQREVSQMSSVGQAIAGVNDKWDADIKAVNLHSNAMQEATKQHDAAIKAAHGNAEAIKAANVKYAEQTKHIHESQAAIAAANKERQAEIDLILKNAQVAADAQIAALTNDPFAALHQKFADLRQSVTDAGFSASDTAARMAVLGAAEAQAVKDLAAQMNTDLLGGIAGYINDAAVKQGVLLAQAQLEYQIKMAGFALTVASLQAQGLATQAVLDAWNYLLGHPPAFTTTGSVSGNAPPAQNPWDIPWFDRGTEGANGQWSGVYVDASGERWAWNGDPMSGAWIDLGGPPSGSGPVVTGSESAAAAAGANTAASIQAQIDAWNKLGQSSVTSPLAALNATFVSMAADATRLGVSLSALQGAYGVAVKDFWDKALAPYETASNVVDQLAAINKTFDDMIAAAQQYGGDQARIEADRLNAVKAFWTQALAPITALQQQLAGGSLGGVSPEAALNAAIANFNNLATKAMGGDAASIQALPTAITDLLNQQKAFSGTGPAYQALVATIQAVLNQILSLGGLAAAPLGGTPALPIPGLPPPVLSPTAGATTAPRPLPLPAGGSPLSLVPVQETDARVEKLVGAIEDDVQAQRDDRSAVQQLRTQVDRLVSVNREQAQQISDLISITKRLTALGESHETQRTQRRGGSGR
jgi:TP901 family phage tail tape measure protein